MFVPRTIRLDGRSLRRRGSASAAEHEDFADGCNETQKGGKPEEDHERGSGTVVYDEFGNVMVLVPGSSISLQ